MLKETPLNRHHPYKCAREGKIGPGERKKGADELLISKLMTLLQTGS